MADDPISQRETRLALDALVQAGAITQAEADEAFVHLESLGEAQRRGELSRLDALARVEVFARALRDRRP